MVSARRHGARAMVPIVRRPTVNLVKYYDLIGGYVEWIIANRALQAIVQDSGGVRIVRKVNGREIKPSGKGDLVALAAQGALDFMVSVKPMGGQGVDLLILDIKAKPNIFGDPRGDTILHIASNAARLALTYVGLNSVLMYFDGMNGFKVMAKVKPEYAPSQEYASRLLKILADAVIRSVKRFTEYRDLMDSIIVGVNTVTKIKAVRIPLSIHWSTKLSAIPIPGYCVKNFSLISAEPVKVLEEVELYGPLARVDDGVLDPGILKAIDEDPYGLLYSIKAHILGNIRVGC